MQETANTAPAPDPRLVVPSRSDPLLRANTEAIGGPLGRHTAPGLIAPGFFTVERVLILLTLVAALVAVMGKAHCRQMGWSTPDQYSTVCWSVFPNVFADRAADAAWVYSPLAAVVAAVTDWLTPVTGPLGQLAFFDINAGLLAAAWIATVVVVARSAGRRPWDAALLACSPLMLLALYVSWTFWAVALVSLGLFLFARGRTLWAGALFGVAAMMAPYAAIVPGVILLLGWRGRRLTPALETAAATMAGALVVLVPTLLVNPATWVDYALRAVNAPASDSSLYGAYNLAAAELGAPQLSGQATNVIAVLLLLAVLGAVVGLALYLPRQPRLASLAAVAVAGVLVLDKFAQPWHGLWLLPLLALALPKWRPVLLWQCAVAVHFVALMLFQSKQLGGIADAHAIDTPYFLLAVVLAGLATCAVVVLLVRDMRTPRHDVVRRQGGGDSLLGPLRGGAAADG